MWKGKRRIVSNSLILFIRIHPALLNLEYSTMLKIRDVLSFKNPNMTTLFGGGGGGGEGSNGHQTMAYDCV